MYGVTITLGAFLLFLLQPMAAKAILPWFGGSAAVWSTCLLFFQAVLLLGYVYADRLDRRLTPRGQSRTHILLLALSVIAIPISLGFNWRPSGLGDPSIGILAVLAGTIGLPYFLLSTTGPLLQAWYRGLGKGAFPYRFYALSNVGSLLALLSYPVIVEPHLSRRSQAEVWLAGFAIYVALAVWLARSRAQFTAAPEVFVDEPEPPSWGLYLFWVSLAACASILLVSITSHLTQNVAPVPLLWVAPLALYLLTFIVCFSHDRAYWRILWQPLAAVAVEAVTLALSGDGDVPTLARSFAIFSAALFACCMFCHGELAKSKPAPRYLTSFYVACALGGALGSLFAALLAPHLFRGNYEVEAGLVLCALLILVALYRQIVAGERHLGWLAVAGGFVALVAMFSIQDIRTVSANTSLMMRNFYGALRVSDKTAKGGETYRELLHGTIIHGAQFIAPARYCDATTYYGPESGLGKAFVDIKWPARVGALGLGAGTVAAYGKVGDYFKFYEINPIVPRLAKSEFKYLDCGARVDIVMGDARLSLERELEQDFDLLVMDAFSGDSVPVHLLTVEAFALYFKHLKEGGVLAVHISNRYINLRPVLEGAARHFNKDLLFIDAPGDGDLQYGSLWGLIAARGRLKTIDKNDELEELDESPNDDTVWTDDFSSVWSVLKWR